MLSNFLIFWIWTASLFAASFEWDLSSEIWEVETAPFKEVVFSWNGQRPKRGIYAFLVRLRQEGRWSPWVYWAEWGAEGQLCLREKMDELEPFWDGVRAKGKMADAFALQVIASGGANRSDLRRIWASIPGGPTTSSPLEPVFLEGVPQYCQIFLRHPRYTDLALPTAMSNAINFLRKGAVDPTDFAERVLEGEYTHYESWAMNAAEGYIALGKEWEVRVAHAGGFQDIHRHLMLGTPVVVSVRGTIMGEPRSFYRPHALCVIGYDPEKELVHCIDSLFPTPRATYVKYPLREFLQAWGKTQNLSCIFIKSLYDKMLPQR